MRFVAAIVLLGACGFDLKLGGADDPGVDAASEPDGMEIDVPVAPVACATPDPTGLVACFELEDGVTDGVLRDSSPGKRDAITTGLVAAERDKPAASAAASATSTMSTYVADAPELDLASGYTVAMWIEPASVPTPQQVYGLFDHEQQYAGVVARSSTGNNAQLRCINTGGQFEWTTDVPTNEWSFVACTWDGERLCAQSWSSTTAHERWCSVPENGIATVGERGLAIGHLSDQGAPAKPFDGSFDSVQVYDHALTSAQMCAIMGQPATCLPCNGGC